MFAEERQKEIKAILDREGSIKVNELSVHFDVSEATIRRDLKEMEDRRILKRTHGGAVPIDITNFEASFVDKKDEGQVEKLAIGKYAANMIKNGDTIILDSGTTTLEIAKNIDAEDITVITNSIDIASELLNRKDKKIELIVAGGILRPNTRAMVGNLCESVFKNFRVDKAFIGANGITSIEGITTPNFTEAQAKKAMINAANKVIVVADSSKFENICFSMICKAEYATAIVTSGELSEEDIKDFKDLGVQIIVA
ncbi:MULTISPECIES: DeoR/GlpR family DNA-binding transcription regulator [Clostridium]|uniref:Transcripcional regulator of sugar metabolism n=1 Tax=Clostridium acetobutylicum (strain ATCC 824 / DSM 792 / JCM 1419 / IAM 19013 / LMG 5710 / NBRC 13948 / NRRL B-527 / VKM B-1787 / 2291 / W) TaxID=272562 RepID=Q97MG7_CLOAB|nr:MULTISPECIES: DeoR/GlpR family DNA-binding transcription regulator [Clostridium]AAK78212.1 Transcripcional regulator of sugar metabolism [Clostridium acetobutylicum ATCC 824]ADZ19277.1 Transcripcional regulator of sugar metabolism [Clostridium acetobutylicum EA 2018]AEI31126.1 transcripcional regulator of sugar metabolism [Clostridium acetobutylicum DSM 1731]AWV82020.1 DeoR/GlpR transcriptional regulator [Clostridium acetobutylicum]KHD34655.1 DeoR faimly transcriptional regulator [Clostridi